MNANLICVFSRSFADSSFLAAVSFDPDSDSDSDSDSDTDTDSDPDSDPELLCHFASSA